MPQITHIPLDAAIQARRKTELLESELITPSVHDSIQCSKCVTLLDEREYEQKEQMWLNEERF